MPSKLKWLLIFCFCFFLILGIFCSNVYLVNANEDEDDDEDNGNGLWWKDEGTRQWKGRSWTKRKGIPGLGLVGMSIGSLIGFYFKTKTSRDRTRLPGRSQVVRGLGSWLGVIRFIALPLFLSLIFVYLVGFEPYQALIARCSSFLLSSLDVLHEREGFSLFLELQGVPYEIVVSEACSGIASVLMFSSLVLGLPGVSTKKRGVALLLGLPFIFIGDILRISFVIYFSHLWDWAPYMMLHDFFGRPISFLWTLLASSIFIFYTFFIKGSEEPSQ